MYKLTFDNNDEYILGGDCIMEGMAYCAEKIVGSKCNLKFFPYKICANLIEQSIGVVDDKIILVLLELSLLHEIPPVCLNSLLNEIKKNKNILSQTPIEIYAHMYKFLNKNNQGRCQEWRRLFLCSSFLQR